MDSFPKIKYELKLDVIVDNTPKDIITIKAENLIQLQSQFTFALLRIQQSHHDDIIKSMKGIRDDDIPF